MSQQLALLREVSLEGLVEHSIKLLRLHQPTDAPYYGCFSGGKDSCVIKRLAEMAGINVVWHYNVTTIDPPELVYFIREHHKDVVWERSKHGNLLRRVRVNGLPTRLARWCCGEFKELHNPGPGGASIQGVRAAESPRRARIWREVTRHSKLNYFIVSPILSWPDDAVWEFIRSEGLPYCRLYDEGFKRLGCIGCPQARRQVRAQFDRWPGFEKAWKLAAQRFWDFRIENARKRGEQSNMERKYGTVEHMWDWWLTGEALEQDEDGSCQTALDMLSGGTE